jgi:hypothetical protein
MFTPAPQAGKKQRVCSAECRAIRCHRLGRSRRQKDLEGFRADERERKRNHRRRIAETRAQMVVIDTAESVPGQESSKCHALPSARNAAKLHGEIHRILDGPFRVSRARFGREIGRIERKIGSLVESLLPKSGQSREMSRARCPG